MLSLVVLFVMFLVLVGVLALLSEWDKKRSSPSLAGLAEVVGWIEEEGCSPPSMEDLVAVFNRAAHKKGLQPDDGSWSDLEITGLLPGTQLPTLTFSRVVLDDRASTMKAVVHTEWPVCVPGIGVAIVMAGGLKVTCHVQVDWMYMKFHLELTTTEEGGGERQLVLSLSHATDPTMALSCVVVTEGINDSDAVASSVTDVLYRLIGGLEAVNEPLIPTPTPTTTTAPDVPTVMVSAPDEKEPAPTPTLSVDSTPSPSASPEAMEEVPEAAETRLKGESEREGGQDSGISADEPLANLRGDHLSEESQTDTDQTDTDQTRQETPEDLNSSSSSSPWRRAPSYERLEHISLPAIAESPQALTPPSSMHVSYSSAELGHGAGRRALTLSMSGDAFEESSSFGTEAEETFPSTLVFEVNDSLRLRHIAAMSPAHAKKLRRRLTHAKKLHIYNDHTFVATRFSGKLRTVCSVCQEKITGRFGKQGYQCRDCRLSVHKSCHYKVETQCPESQVSNMKLIYPDSVSTASEIY